MICKTFNTTVCNIKIIMLLSEVYIQAKVLTDIRQSQPLHIHVINYHILYKLTLKLHV